MYFSGSWMSPSEVAGTLYLKGNPFWSGLGVYEDVDGVKWDVVGVMGRPEPERSYVQARRLSDSPEYYSTATNAYSGGLHTWEPYYVEVQKEKE